jgi:hypothetical protein
MLAFRVQRITAGDLPDSPDSSRDDGRRGWIYERRGGGELRNECSRRFLTTVDK